jgi:hypothetical protein
MKFIFALVFICSLASCTNKPSVLFDQPQPPNGADLKVIPKRLWGDYQSGTDSSILTVNNNVLSKTISLYLNQRKIKLDSGTEMHGDTLINLKTHEKINLTRVNDSMLVYKYSDTLFSLTGKNVLRKFKGYYFLNKPYGSEWEVRKLSLSKGILTISSISDKESIENLNEIKETGADTLNHHVAPTRKQFRKFVKSQGFIDGEEFVKVK